jgi:phage terminase large subunit-like protein
VRSSSRSLTLSPHVAAAERYVDDVLSGREVVCRLVRLACERHRRDRAQAEKGWLYRFDEAKAEQYCQFIELLPHVKGKWARPLPGQSNRIQLEPWQCFLIVSLFGWVHVKTGLRRFRKAVIMVPRKQGKSMKAAAIGLAGISLDDEPAAEVYCGATTEKQAWEVFRPAKLMAKSTPDFLDAFGIEVNAKSISRDDSSRFEPVIGKPGDGASPHIAIVDEYHEHDSSDQYDTFLTGMGARSQPLLLVISTAGESIEGPCYDEQETLQKVLEGVIQDEELFGVVYSIDPDDEWSSPEAYRKANPNLGVSVSEEFLEARRKEAIQNPRKTGTYKIKHLNVWVQALNAFYDIEAWKRCAVEGLTLEELAGRPCWVAIDLASKIDIAAVQYVFPPTEPGEKWATLGRYYLPEAQLEDAAKAHYRGWATDGWLEVTEGNITDIGQVEEDLLESRSIVNIQGVLYDPHQATQIVTRLQAAGVPMIEHPMTVLMMSEPMKESEALILGGNLEHDGNPCMTWMMSNVVAKLDAKDNVYPRKNRVDKKIDGPVAFIMGVGAGIRHSVEEEEEEVVAWVL